MYWIIVFFGFLGLLAASYGTLYLLKKRGIIINRWIWAISSFAVVIVPNLIFQPINQIVSYILYAFCGLFALNFMIEQHDRFVKRNSQR